MFPSPNCNNPFESLLKIRPSSPSSFPSHHQNPNPPSLLFNFPSPFLDEHESPLNQIFFQNHHHLLPAADHAHSNLGKSKAEEIDRIIPSAAAAAAAAAPPRRRRTGKKDRHSKICTAQGIRDRRMRLSLQVARKFFDLQDMLGFDKASKTIEWLFTQSRKAIKELVDGIPSESFLSECDQDPSGIEEINSSNVVISPTPMEMTKPSTRPDARESRERARARARSRTREKMMMKRLQLFSQDCLKPDPSFHDSNIISPFEGVDQEKIRVSPHSSLQQQLNDVGVIEKFLGSSSSPTSCPISEYHCAAAVSDYGDPDSALMGFVGNWDVVSNDRPNCFQYSVTNNQISFPGNLNSVYAATAEFP